MLNLAAAVERAAEFDIIHYEAAYYPMSLAFTRLSPTPIVQTLHHSPSAAEVQLWSRYPEAPFVAISQRAGAPARRRQRRRHRAARHRHRQLRVSRDARRLPAVPRPLHRRQGRAAGDRGRQARRHAADPGRRRGRRTIASTSRRTSTARRSSTSARPTITAKVQLYGGARALLYPIQAREPFGLVLAEAMACGTPVAALDRGAVREVVDDGVTGLVFNDLEADDRRAAARVRARSPPRPRARGRAVRRRAHGRRVHRRLPPDRGGASCPSA